MGKREIGEKKGYKRSDKEGNGDTEIQKEKTGTPKEAAEKEGAEGTDGGRKVRPAVWETQHQGPRGRCV